MDEWMKLTPMGAQVLSRARLECLNNRPEYLTTLWIVNAGRAILASVWKRNLRAATRRKSSMRGIIGFSISSVSSGEEEEKEEEEEGEEEEEEEEMEGERGGNGDAGRPSLPLSLVAAVPGKSLRRLFLADNA